jgi:transposase
VPAAENSLNNLPEDSASLKALLCAVIAERDRAIVEQDRERPRAEEQSKKIAELRRRAEQQTKRADELYIEKLPKHPMAEAVNYVLGQWTELTVFCSDGAVPIDNNVSEREMKRVVLNRKNSLFVGNPRGGRTAAILASLASSCRRHEVDPQLYFTQLLLNLPPLLGALPHAKLRELQCDLDAWLPDNWKLLHAARAALLSHSAPPAHPSR